jgi:hypothetical protein
MANDSGVKFYSTANEFASQRLRDFVDLWQKAKGTNRLAPVSAIDPLNFKPFLRDVAVFDVEADPENPRYRLVGTGIREFFDHDFTGMEVAKTGTAFSEKMADICRAIARDGNPCFGQYTWLSSSGAQHKCEFTLLPYGSGDHVECIAGMDDLDQVRAQLKA